MVSMSVRKSETTGKALKECQSGTIIHWYNSFLICQLTPKVRDALLFIPALQYQYHFICTQKNKI